MRLRWIGGGCLALLLAGCAGYRLGPTHGLEARSHSIQVNLFQNQTFQPRLGEIVTQALRKRLQQEGTFKLATQNDGDLVVRGVLTRYDRQAIAFQPNDTITPQDYEVTLFAHVVAEEPATGRKMLDRDVRARITVRSGPDQTSAERQAMPVLAATLADTITALLVDGEW